METVVLTVDDTDHRLSRAAAGRLRAALSDALTRRRVFVHTAVERRADGTYVVDRRRADSDGNRLTFASRAALHERFRALPGRFDVTDVAGPGVTGSRRHLLVRCFAEHPAFDCTLVSENPLIARKTGPDR